MTMLTLLTNALVIFFYFFANPQQSYGLVWEWSVGNKISRRTGKGENESPLQLTNTYARPTGASLEY